MASPNPSTAIAPAMSAEEAAASAARKRYETLCTIKSRAVNGKGAWYWNHLEPFLVFAEDGIPKAAKLKCLLCNSTFSASNPSRTSNDHFKKGSCPNFNVNSASASIVKPISSAPPVSRKRPVKPNISDNEIINSYSNIAPPPHLPTTTTNSVISSSNLLMLSCGKEDLGALALLEDSVKRLKSPKAAPGPPLPREKADAAISMLQEWVFENCGSVSLNALRHSKFTDFLNLVGMPSVDPRRMLGPVLDSKYREVVEDAECKVRDAVFYQLSCSGWKNVNDEELRCVNFTINLPNGTTVFRRAFIIPAYVPPSYAEEVIEEMVSEKCVGIVCDRFKSKALVHLENKHGWVVNLSCQMRAIGSLIKDFVCHLTLFETVIANCFKLASYFNMRSEVRRIFQKYQLQEFGRSRLFRAPVNIANAITHFDPIFAMIEDVLESISLLHLVVLDEEYKIICNEDHEALESGELIKDERFWSEIEAVHSIVKIIKEMTSEMELERPLVGQCLPLWNELRSKVRDWCNKFNIEFVQISKIIEKRFRKNYHPAWSAAFMLDPIYLIKDASGKYLPPFELLTSEQVKDVEKLITRLVSSEEAHIALMEYMRYRTEGLDPLYAQAVQMKQPDPLTGKMKITNPQSSRLVWGTRLSGFKTLGKVAVRIIFLHATSSCGLRSDPPVLKWIHGQNASRVVDKVEKMVAIAAHAKLERRDFVSEEIDAKILDKLGDNALVSATSL